MREWQSLDSRRPGDRGSDHGGRVPRTWKMGAVTCRISTGRGTQEADRSGLSGCVSWPLSDMSPACPERTVSAHPAPRLVQKPRPQARASFPHWLKSRWDDWGGGFRPWRLLRASPLCNSVFETLLCPPPHLPLRSLAGLSPLQPSVRGDVPRGRAAVPSPSGPAADSESPLTWNVTGKTWSWARQCPGAADHPCAVCLGDKQGQGVTPLQPGQERCRRRLLPVQPGSIRAVS